VRGGGLRLGCCLLRVKDAVLFLKNVIAQVGWNFQRRARVSSRKRFFFKKKRKNFANLASVSPGEPNPK
jgi:hypothetical protein